jgi:hypothetical protein
MARPAAAAVALGKQLDKAHPSRPKRASMEGICGDSAHAKHHSDHNANTGVANAGPYPDKCGCCHARDLTMGPWATPAWCKAVSKDRRVKYVICKRRIYKGGISGPYSGSNPHTDHVHVSLSDRHRLHSDTGAFPFGSGPKPVPSLWLVSWGTPKEQMPLIVWARVTNKARARSGRCLVVHAKASAYTWKVIHWLRKKGVDIHVVATTEPAKDVAKAAARYAKTEPKG